MFILVIGDIMGKPGRQAVEWSLPGLRKQYELDLIIANGENAAGGFGMTAAIAEEMMGAGVQVLTSGNHIWAQKDIFPYLDELPVLRPLNYPPGVPGRGYIFSRGVMVVNLMGRTFMNDIDCPFRAMDALLEQVQNRPKVIIVDFHAEATSEKVAMGRYLDGRVSAVLGTHTHVGTVDAGILPGGTAYVSDIGMTGPGDSVIGVEAEAVIQRFLTGMPFRLVVAKGKPELNAMLVEVDEKTGRALKIERISYQEEYP